MAQLSRVGIRVGRASLAFTLMIASVLAQTAPCGKTVLRTGGDKTEDRFVPAPLEHVKSSIIKALPAVAARLTKDEGSHIEAKIDWRFAQDQQDAAFGSDGRNGGLGTGTFHIDLTPETQNGVAGTRMAISVSMSFRDKMRAVLKGSGKYATPLADETICLVTLLGPVEPTTKPRGGVPASAQSNSRSVNLKAKTPVRVALRNYLYTKEVPKKTHTLDVTLEVVEDVHADDGTVVIRKGALAKGRVSDLTNAKSYGRRAAFRFVVESATAVDGQEVALDSATVERKGTSPGVVALHVALAGGAAVQLLGVQCLLGLLLTPLRSCLHR